MVSLPRSTDSRISPVAALALVTTIGVLLRLRHLDQPIRYDEAITAVAYVYRPLAALVSDYAFPNNHILHSLLARGSVTLFGDALWALRLPAFLAGCLMIPLTWLVARRITTPPAALLAAALVAGSGALTLYSTNARGYTLLTDATLLLAWIVLRARERARPWHWPLFALVAAAGLWTVPTMLYPLGGMVLWTLMLGWRGRGEPGGAPWRRFPLRAACAAIAGGGLAVGCYWPVIGAHGLAPLVRNPYVTPSDFAAFFRSELPAGIVATARLFTLGLPGFTAASIGALAITGLVVTRGGRPVRPLVPLLLWSLVLLLAMHRFPFARVWLFLLPFLCIAVADGTTWLLDRLRLRGETPWIPVGVTALLAMALVTGRDVLASRETGTLPDAREIATRIAREVRPGDRVEAATWAPLAFWLRPAGLDGLLLLGEDTGARRILAVVNLGEGQRPDEVLARFGNTVVSSRTIATFPQALLLEVMRR